MRLTRSLLEEYDDASTVETRSGLPEHEESVSLVSSLFVLDCLKRSFPPVTSLAVFGEAFSCSSVRTKPRPGLHASLILLTAVLPERSSTSVSNSTR
jgi:hypothetical protein